MCWQLAVVYVSVSVPIHVTFLIRPAPGLDGVVDALFVMDVLLQFLQVRVHHQPSQLCSCSTL